MAPRTFVAPRVWKSPYTSIYNDNYRYGNSLYSSAISDIERKYNDSLSRTTFRSDRPDLKFESFSPSLSGEPSSPLPVVPRPDLTAAAGITTLDSRFESNLDLSRTSLRKVEKDTTDSFHAYQSAKALASMEVDLEEARSRRRRRRPESGIFMDSISGSVDAASQALWMERW